MMTITRDKVIVRCGNGANKEVLYDANVQQIQNSYKVKRKDCKK